MQIIAVTGTPGAGKTRLSERLAKDLGFHHLDLNSRILENKRYLRMDKQRDTAVVDESKIGKITQGFLPGGASGAVVDSHMSHFLDPSSVVTCIAVKARLPTIKRRLEKRGYPSRKVRENLDAEIFDICLTEAQERGHKVIIANSPLDREAYRTLLKAVRKALISTK
ncbi:MAG: AAA family ATPase [archaeon]